MEYNYFCKMIFSVHAKAILPKGIVDTLGGRNNGRFCNFVTSQCTDVVVRPNQFYNFLSKRCVPVQLLASDSFFNDTSLLGFIEKLVVIHQYYYNKVL